jgi:putative PIN family toxin of toxin-antitoxin system
VRVLFDANVWISAAITDGFSRKVIRAAMMTETVVTSSELTADVVEKLRDSLKQLEILVDSTERTMRRCHFFEGPCKVLPRCRDADDDILIAQAVATNCQFLVTNDKDLLVLQKVESVTIVRPFVVAALLGMQ